MKKKKNNNPNPEIHETANWKGRQRLLSKNLAC